MGTVFFFFFISLLLQTETSASSSHRILHEPLFPIQWTPPPPPPEDPFPESPATPSPFFPDSPPQSGNIQTPPIPPTSSNANRSPNPNSSKKIAIAASVSIALLALLSLSAFLLLRLLRRRRARRPPDARKLIGRADEDPSTLQPPPAAPEFLYLGTMEPATERRRASDPIGPPFRKLSSERVVGDLHQNHHHSPELQPLPPLIGPASIRRVPSDDDETFYTANRSMATSLTSGSPGSPVSRRSLAASSGWKETEPNPRSRRTSPRMQLSSSPPHSHIKPAIQLPDPPPPPPPPPPLPPPPQSEKIGRPPPPPSGRRINEIDKNIPLPPEASNRPSSRRQLLRPLPPEAVRIDPPITASRLSNGSSNAPQLVDEAEDERPRLKPLHWDKVRASSDRAMVWDQLKSSSFQLNEDMIQTLFVNSATNPPPLQEINPRSVLPQFKQENRVLDPKKSQNIAILLRALNVTREEVTEALLDGNPEGLGAELLETLVKMAPTKEEEHKLRDYNGDVSKLGSAERFLKAVLDVPFAFKRVDAMLYRANFESEVKYLWKSFETLEAACGDLSSSRLFLKLLEAVLKTGNRMNVGTNRGEAKAFKLDTLLKLADVKGTDGKTTLLHFVVQELIRSEGSTSADSDPPSKPKDDEFRKQGLKVLAGLSSELGNVKKAAGMDSDVLSGYVKKLELGLEKIRSVLQLERSCEQGLKLFDSMRAFLGEAEGEISRVKAEEKRVMCLVKEITEYFHGDAAKEEAHPLRIFMVVRDFLSVLDHVCKEVGRLQERAVMGSASSFRIPTSASLPVLHRYDPSLHRTSDEESLSS